MAFSLEILYNELPSLPPKADIESKVVYTPPEEENLIRAKLKDLEDFIHAKDNIDPLIKMAMIRY